MELYFAQFFFAITICLENIVHIESIISNLKLGWSLVLIPDSEHAVRTCIKLVHF